MKNQFHNENQPVLCKKKVLIRGLIPLLILMILMGLEAKPLSSVSVYSDHFGNKIASPSGSEKLSDASAMAKLNSPEGIINFSAPFMAGISDLQILKTVELPAAIVGTSVTFTITVTNNGPDRATDLVITDVLPAGFTLVSATPSSGTWTAPHWNIITLGNGLSATLVLVAVVNETGPYRNVATVTGNYTDPVPGNNSDDAELTTVYGKLVAVNEYIGMCSQKTVTGNILANGDYDPHGGVVSVRTVPVSGASHGTIVIKSNGDFTYTVESGFSGIDRVVVPVCSPKNCGYDTLFFYVDIPLEVSAGSDIDLCRTNSAVLNGKSITHSGGLWSQISGPNNAILSGSTSPQITVSGLITGTYLFRYRLTLGSCTEQDTVQVTLWGPPVAYAGDDVTMCSDNYNVIIDATASNYSTVHWTHNGKGTLYRENTLNPVYHSGVTEIGDVTFTLTVKPKGNDGCPTVTDSKVGTVLKGPQVICPKQKVYTFNATPGYCGYLVTDSLLDASHAGAWSPDVAVNHDFFTWGNSHTLRGAIIPVGTKTIKWWVNSYLSRCTSDTCSIIVNVLDTQPPEFVNCADGMEFTVGLFSGDCEGGAIWAIPIAKDACSEVKVEQVKGPSPGTKLEEGKYHIQYVATDASGNTDTCGFVLNVANTESPLIACQPNIIMKNDPGVCTWTSGTHSLTPLLASSNCPYTIIWNVTNPDGTISRGNKDVSGYVFQPGVSTVKYIISLNSGVVSDSCFFTVTVTDDSPPVITCQPPISAVTSAGKCDKEIALTLPAWKDNCSKTVNITYIVHNPDNSIKGPFAATSLTYKFMVGVSQVIWTVTDDAGNMVQCYQEVRITADNKDLIPNAGTDAIICEGSTFQVTGATTAPNVTLIWSTNGTGTFNNASLLNPVYTPSAADILNGWVILTLTAYSECASAMDHMILTITPYPKIYAGPDLSLCAGETLLITGATAKNVSSVRWTTSGKGILSGSTTLNPAYKPAAGEYGWLTFIVFGKGMNGCSTVEVSDTMRVIIHEPLVVIASDDISILYNTTAVLSVSVSQGSGSYSFEWKPTDKVYTFNTPRTETLPLLTDSRFSITVTDNEWGCTGKDSVFVTVKTDIDDLITIYNAISPNGDGENDSWWVEGINLFPENKVTIFNRWGDKVREFHKYDNRIVFWDGTNRQGEFVSDGTYYYVLEIKDIKTYTGWIQVKRSF